MSDIFWLCRIVYLGRAKYVVNDAEDGLHLDKGAIRFFESVAQTNILGLDRSFDDPEEELLHDFDACLRLLTTRGGLRLNTGRANLINDCFSLLEDMCSAIGDEMVSNYVSQNKSPLRRIFWSCNYPPVTPPGKCFRAFLTGREVRTLKVLFEAGLPKTLKWALT
jgi:hypothetical protein